MLVKIPELAFGMIIPELIVTASAVIALLLGAFGRRAIFGTLAGGVALLGSGLALLFTVSLWNASTGIFNNLYTIDNFGTFFKGLALIVAILVTLLSLRYVEREDILKGEYYALLLFGVLGMMIMVSSTHFVTIFIGLEVMSIAIYVLCGLLSGNPRSAEASLKYFLLGAFATAFLLYGMALIYATTGLLDVREIAGYLVSGNFRLTPLFMIGLAMLVVGFGFKTASVPFHMWTPDVYEGAPTSITAFMATGIKAAAFGAFLRVFYTAFLPLLGAWSGMLWLIAVATMTVGNITALVQDDVKRMLAYSSIAHAGYILIAFLIGDRFSAAGILYYILVYTFMNIGAFAVVILLGQKDCAADGDRALRRSGGPASRDRGRDDGLSPFPRRDTAPGGIHGEILCPERGHPGRILLACRDRRPEQRRGGLLLPQSRDVHVFPGTGGGDGPAGLLAGLYRGHRHQHLGALPYGYLSPRFSAHRREIGGDVHVATCASPCASGVREGMHAGNGSPSLGVLHGPVPTRRTTRSSGSASIRGSA